MLNDLTTFDVNVTFDTDSLIRLYAGLLIVLVIAIYLFSKLKN